MKRTLLDMTQNILGAMNADSVNSIGDTTESTQVAEVIKTTYYNILGRAELPEHDKLFQLISASDTTKPTLMFAPPQAVSKLNWVKYFDANPNDGTSLQVSQYGAYRHDLNVDIQASNWSTNSFTSNTMALGYLTFTVTSSTLPIFVNQGVTVANGTNTMSGVVVSYAGTTLVLNIVTLAGSGTFAAWTIQSGGIVSLPGYKHVEILPVEEFLHQINTFDTTQGDVHTFSFTSGLTSSETGDTFTFKYKNDRQPQFCTCLQNYYYIFDSYDATLDATLQSSKTMCSGFITPTWSATDSFIPDLDDWAFPLLLNEAKSLAFYEIKQAPHPHADEEIKWQWISLQKTKSQVNKPTWFDQLPHFGRSRGCH